MACIKVYLPKDAKHAKDTLPVVKRLISGHLGGYTTYEGSGGWRDSNGDLIHEDVWVIESYGESYQKTYDVAGRSARLIKRMTNEESVLVSVNHEPRYL